MEKNVIVSDEIRKVAPDYRMVYIEADVVNGPSTPALIAEMDRVCERITAGLEIPDINRRPPIAATRAAYKALGKEPNRYRPSQEQLMRRLLKGQGLYHVDSLVDVGNMVSLESGSSIGVFDRDKIQGDTLTLGVGGEGEPYEGIGRGPLNIAGLPVIRDAVGGIGTPTSDNERTKVDADTRRISICINMYDSHTVSPEEALRLMTDALLNHCSASSVSFDII